MHSGDVRKFHQRKEFGPVVLLVVAAGWEVLFHGLVLPFGLAVCLVVEGGQESIVDTHVGEDSSRESAGELRSAVGDDVVVYAMLADHVLEEHRCHFRWVDFLAAGHVHPHLR